MGAEAGQHEAELGVGRSRGPRSPALELSVRAAGPLFIGLTILLASVGLQNAAIGLRARYEGFSPGAIGLIMSMYYVGFLAGSRRAPADLERVGHVRVFAALAAMASIAVLLHPVLVNPIAWALLRATSGFCISGLYVTAESWLNAESNNSIRGSILSVYLVVVGIGISAGQFLLNVADVSGPSLFMLASVLSSLSLLPLVLTPTPGPRFVQPERMAVAEVAKLVPLGIAGCFASGITQGAFFGMGAVYANRIGLGTGDVASFLSLLTIGGVILQFPIGAISDRVDRRLVIAVSCIAATGGSAALSSVDDPGLTLWVLVFAVGGLSLPLYSLAAAHANDFLSESQMVSVAATLVLVFGLGAALGPVGVSAVMNFAGDSGYPIFLGVAHALLAGYALWRVSRREAAPKAHRASFLETLPLEGAQVDLVDGDPSDLGTDPMLL